MKKTRIILLIIMSLLITSGYAVQYAFAAERHLPVADTYVDMTSPDVNYGSEQYMQLSASNAAGCYPTSYLWFKFNVPDLAETIGYAEFVVPFTVYGDDGTMDLELRSSSDTSWGENSLTWDTQPALDATVLATRSSTPRGADALFESAELASYLNAHRGQTVTLVLKANCDGSVFTIATRVVASKENSEGTDVELILKNNATSVGLQSFTTRNKTAPFILIAFVLAGCLFFLGIWQIWRLSSLNNRT